MSDTEVLVWTLAIMGLLIALQSNLQYIENKKDEAVHYSVLCRLVGEGLFAGFLLGHLIWGLFDVWLVAGTVHHFSLGVLGPLLITMALSSIRTKSSKMRVFITTHSALLSIIIGWLLYGWL